MLKECSGIRGFKISFVSEQKNLSYFNKRYRMIKATEHQINVRACLHRGGEPQVGEVTHLGGVS